MYHQPVTVTHKQEASHWLPSGMKPERIVRLYSICVPRKSVYVSNPLQTLQHIFSAEPKQYNTNIDSRM